MNHSLLVAKQVVPQPVILLQRLPDSRDISVSEDSQASAKKLIFLTVARGELIPEELYGSLRSGQRADINLCLFVAIADLAAVYRSLEPPGPERVSMNWKSHLRKSNHGDFRGRDLDRKPGVADSSKLGG